MNQQVSIAPENALLGAQGLVGQGMVLEMPHAPMAIVVGLQNIEHTSDARVPPPGPKREGRQGSKRCGHGGFGSGGVSCSLTTASRVCWVAVQVLA